MLNNAFNQNYTLALMHAYHNWHEVSLYCVLGYEFIALSPRPANWREARNQ